MKFRVGLAMSLWFGAATGGAADMRQLAPLPVPAQEAIREEMRDNLFALQEILELLAADKLTEAGQVAETRLGRSAMGRHRMSPMDARPGAHMPREMHALGMDGHLVASEFARAAASGNREQAYALLPKLTSSCVACHAAYRIR